ncbi:MAG: DUF4178 domain-containing protein [Nitrospirae bacterium]|nr:DUF4178 domain-containing protein [Nitrospirota bacterium]
MKANCPSCGAEVSFKSSVSVFSVCDHCRFMLVRHDMDIESLGKMAQLPDDVSPLKIGSRGKFKNRVFEIIGRLKVAWSDGYWNEWYLLFEDGKRGWLAEAMGLFMLSFEVEDTSLVPARDKIRVGEGYDLIPSRRFIVDDIKESTCIGSEGELPFVGLAGRKATSVDLSSGPGEFAAIEYSGQDGISLYTGRYVEFQDLELSNLRYLETDLKKIRSAEAFKCPSCGGPFSLLTPGITASAACKYCGSIIDTTNENLSVLSRAEKQIKIKPLIPLGSKGRLFATEWEVTGFMRRTDESGNYPWDEYLLFNPRRGFRWLTTYHGHWNYVEMLRGRLAGQGPRVTYGGKSFRQFLAGKGRVYFVLGEFYWRVRTGDEVYMTDYICPPEVLSLEAEKSEVNWSLGKYIEPQEVALAFGIKEQMPPKQGVAPNQPNPYGGHSKPVSFAFLAFAILVTLVQFYFIFASHDKEVYRGSFTFSDQTKSQPIVTPSFEVPGGSGNLSVTLSSPVVNDWIEAGVDLIEDGSGKRYELGLGAEYYKGSDSDGSWAEGSQTSDHALSVIPGGRYHMIIQPGGPANAGNKGFTLSLRRDVVIWSNYFVALMLLSIYPLCVCWKSWRFELKRWSESDLSSGGGADEEEGGTEE